MASAAPGSRPGRHSRAGASSGPSDAFGRCRSAAPSPRSLRWLEEAPGGPLPWRTACGASRLCWRRSHRGPPIATLCSRAAEPPPMRVLLITDWMRLRGGVEGYVSSIREGLRAAGDEVRLLTTTAGSPAEASPDYLAYGTERPAAQALLQVVNPSAVTVSGPHCATSGPTSPRCTCSRCISRRRSSAHCAPCRLSSSSTSTSPSAPRAGSFCRMAPAVPSPRVWSAGKTAARASPTGFATGRGTHCFAVDSQRQPGARL